MISKKMTQVEFDIYLKNKVASKIMNENNAVQTSIQDMEKLGKGTPKWFETAFEGKMYPEWLKKAVIHICDSYGIYGQADPAYIANVIEKYELQQY